MARTAVHGTAIVAQKTVGTRTVMNNNFGRLATVRREPRGAHVTWVVQVACNGICEYSRVFSTRRDALEDFNSL